MDQMGHQFSGAAGGGVTGYAGHQFSGATGGHTEHQFCELQKGTNLVSSDPGHQFSEPARNESQLNEQQ